MRRSRLCKSCRQPSSRCLSPTPSFMFNATSSARKASTIGHSSWQGKLSTVPRASSLPGRSWLRSTLTLGNMIQYATLPAWSSFKADVFQALLTLNSCPMFTFNGRDAHRALPALKVHLPFHRPIGDILPERHKTEDDEVCL